MTRRLVPQTDLVADVMTVLRDDPTATANAVVRRLRHRRRDVLAIVRVLRGKDAVASVALPSRRFPFAPGRGETGQGCAETRIESACRASTSLTESTWRRS